MESERVYENKTISILLITVALVLLGSGIFNIQLFSIQYGIGAGALITSNSANTLVTPVLSYTASETSLFYQAILESYLITAIAFVLFSMAFVLWLHGQNGYLKYLRFYIPLHLLLILLYSIILLVIYSSFNFSLYSSSLDITYLAIAITIILDSFLGYKIYLSRMNRSFKGIKISPSKPYSNILLLREKLFSMLTGEVGIVDKHFNSQALENLHRLILGNQKISKITIITYNEMFDSSFNKEYRDLKNELNNMNIDLEIKLMKPEEAIEQHERFIFDSESAYKIPPLNIINKKSEHIVKMSRRDAVNRFDELVFNSIKL